MRIETRKLNDTEKILNKTKSTQNETLNNNKKHNLKSYEILYQTKNINQTS